jgi:transposase
LTQIEAAFRTMKSELGIRPIYHQLEHRVEAHI